MSKIRDKAREKIAEYLYKNFTVDGAKSMPYWSGVRDSLRQRLLAKADEILSIPELAVVDREAELPDCPYHRFRQPHCPYGKAQQDMCKAGWIKEDK